ncbi:MAG: serine/threonine-protein kinase, partial [Myxococcota bacterium]
HVHFDRRSETAVGSDSQTSSTPSSGRSRRGLRVGATGVGVDGRKYRLVAPLQRGGMGELFLAEMALRGVPPERVVIKRLLADLQEDDKYVRMFRSEAAVMARLQHSNIVRLLDTPVFETTQCLAMEFVYGRSLQQVLHRYRLLERRLPPRIALTVMTHVLRGLHYAHTFNQPNGRPLELVHRDVSPGNVLVGFNGTVKLTDFGIAKSRMSLVSTTVGIVKGKARYLAPEQILGAAASPRSDVFSAAVVTVELLTGESLFERPALPGTLHAIVRGERPPVLELFPEASASLIDALESALTVEPDERFATAEAFSKSLLRAIKDYGGPATGPELGDFLQNLFRDRDLLPPLSAELEHDNFEPPASVPASVPISRHAPNDDSLSVTELGVIPKTAEPWSSVDATVGMVDGPPEPQIPWGPSFNEAMSALALFQSADRPLAERPASPERALPPLDPYVPQAPLSPASYAPQDGALHHAPPRRASAISDLHTQPGRASRVALEDEEDRSHSIRFGLGQLAMGAAIGVVATLLVQSIWSPSEPIQVSVRPSASSDSYVPVIRSTELRAFIDILGPAGGLIVIDGRPLEQRAPVYRVEVSPGAHTLRILKGRQLRAWTFITAPGDFIEVGRRLRIYSLSEVVEENPGTSGVRTDSSRR